MTQPKKKPPPKEGEYSAFKTLLKKIARVPKAEIDKQEVRYQDERQVIKRAKKVAG